MKLVDGYPLEFTSSLSRRGRECGVKDVVRSAPSAVKKARENSLAVKGAKMFNLLPSEIRNISLDRVIVFKRKLDKYLATIPDQPTIIEEGRNAESNSLLHQLPLLRRQWAKIPKVEGAPRARPGRISVKTQYQVSSINTVSNHIWV